LVTLQFTSIKGNIKNMFNKKSIRSAVMKVINNKIEEAQKAFDVEIIDLDRELRMDIERLKIENNIQKEEVENKFINSIIGKII